MGKKWSTISIFLFRPLSREGKFTHAEVFDISSGGSSRQELPYMLNGCKFSKPNTGDGLMTFDEVETLFTNLAMFYTTELENQICRFVCKL